MSILLAENGEQNSTNLPCPKWQRSQFCGGIYYTIAQNGNGRKSALVKHIGDARRKLPCNDIKVQQYNDVMM